MFTFYVRFGYVSAKLFKLNSSEQKKKFVEKQKQKMLFIFRTYLWMDVIDKMGYIWLFVVFFAVTSWMYAKFIYLNAHVLVRCGRRHPATKNSLSEHFEILFFIKKIRFTNAACTYKNGSNEDTHTHIQIIYD